MQNHCDHGEFNGDGCVVIYDTQECPMCALVSRKKLEDKLHKVELSFRKLEDGTCNIFADIFSLDNVYHLTAEQARFVSVKLYNTDGDKHVLLNVPYKNLKNFAENILKKGG